MDNKEDKSFAELLEEWNQNTDMILDRYIHEIKNTRSKAYYSAFGPFTVLDEFVTNFRNIKEFYNLLKKYTHEGEFDRLIELKNRIESTKFRLDYLLHICSKSEKLHGNNDLVEYRELYWKLLSEATDRNVFCNYAALTGKSNPIIQKICIGDEILLGNYMLSHLRWNVLDVFGDDNYRFAYLLCDECIEEKVYDVDRASEWRETSLRKWLNGEFFRETFNEKEKEAICTAGFLGEYWKSDKEIALDKVFLLSKNDLEKYMSTDVQKCIDIENKIGEVNSETWWLRTSRDKHTAYVATLSGKLKEEDRWDRDIGVRPALLVQLDLLDNSNFKKLIHKYIKTTIFFGQYPQSYDGKESEMIEWYVIDYEYKTNKALIMSKYALDYRRLSDEEGKTTWEKCALRKWLNNYFFKKAFSEKDREAIYETECRDTGSKTSDRIFILNFTQFIDLADNVGLRICEMTGYAQKHKGLKQNSDEIARNGSRWWLRPRLSSMDFVDENGSMNLDRIRFDTKRNPMCAVRPVMWVDLNKFEHPDLFAE